MEVGGIMIKLILLGLDFHSENLGCQALGYSFLEILDQIAVNNQVKFQILSVNYNLFELKREHYEISTLKIRLKSTSFFKTYWNALANADYVIDFTGGDSFTDIYGMSRFLKETMLKQMALFRKCQFVMGPQTIGPFENPIAIRKAKQVLRKSMRVYVRDEISKKYASEKLGCRPILTTDIAFLLPKSDINFSDKREKMCVGLNVSALMWHGGYTKNAFGLTFNYQVYCETIIEKMLAQGMEIHLIAHVITKEHGMNEDDYAVAEELKRRHPELIVAPKFQTPMEAKGYIANMDVFIGSRMHATIGAFSSGIPTIAVAYSRKFQGLYHSLQYDYVINAKKATLEAAVKQTMDWIQDADILKKQADISRSLAVKKCNAFVRDLETMFISGCASVKR